MQIRPRARERAAALSSRGWSRLITQKLRVYSNQHPEDGQWPTDSHHMAALAQASQSHTPFAIPQRLIHGGEEIVLSIKPGAMFVLLSGAPFIAALAIVAMTGLLVDMFGIFQLPLYNLAMVCLTAALARVFIGCFQWLGRTYVLTNKRIICIRGIFGISIFECPLNRVQNTILAMSLSERIFGLGTIMFATAGTGRLEASWDMIARPIEVHEILVEYINRAQHGKTEAAHL